MSTGFAGQSTVKGSRVRRFLQVCAAVAVVGSMAAPAQADVLRATTATINGAIFTTQAPGASAPKGVSPEVFFDATTGSYLLLTTSMPPVQYTSADGITWTPTSVQLPQGIDWSIVQEGPSSYRLYFAEMSPSAPGQGPTPPCTPGSKRLRYATSTDLATWQVQPGVLLDDVGCGVPHVMKTRDGRYFLYFNKRDPVHGIYVGTSNDGLAWAVRDGIIANDSDLVDPAPLQLPDGTFLMVGSTTGGMGGYQKLQLLRSDDAVNWTKRSTSLYEVKGASVLDPSIELVNGKLRVWFGYAPGGAHNDATIATGTLSLGSTKAVKGKKCTVKGSLSGSLACKEVKGRLTWAPT
ncbi:MAG: hypothetical protein KGP12_11740 [Actinomycetales bacterium]|nr:hypothetical protein [Actinomycetales bacterium]